MDKSANRVHLHCLPFVARLDDIGSYSWGAAALAWLYRCMCRVANRNIVWEPYGSLDVLAVIHQEILTEEHSRLWQAITSLIYFAVIEWHRIDRVFPQLGGVQHLPELALNIEYLHSKDGRGGDRWFLTYYRTWHQHWDEQVRSVLRITFVDPRPTQVPNDAILRGSSQAPTRVPASDMPDNRRVERRRCIGRRATDHEWRWLDDMMQEEQVGGDDGGQVDHHLRQSSARRRAGSSRGHPTDTQVGGTAEASMGGTPFTHVSGSQVLHECSTQMLADLVTNTFAMDLDDQLAGPQFYADVAEIIRGDDVHQYQSSSVSGSQVLHECSTQMLADLVTTTFAMDLDDQLARPQFYADVAEIIRGDDVHQYQSPIPGGLSDPPEYRP
ncbi:hypothetical protein Ahy_B09g099070 [Arachis hypogaea]|uniref:Aminotransferase-like plant mobile domain-containing protein n=1 Tax=Arachis hypogaea TaxID=3818 RepID=A0A444XSY8_ARAHY|nr:hypothetical protein Ahy_B09g099070 [Arachis hypogaea]